MQIAVTLKSVSGRASGIPRLELNFSAKNTSQFNLGIVRVAAEVCVAPSMDESDMRKCPFIGFGEEKSQSGQFSMGTEQYWSICVPLQPYALTAIEKARNAGDLFLVVQFFCTATYMNNNASPLTNLARAAVYAESHSTPYCYFKVAQSEWEKTLRDLAAPTFWELEEVIRRASEAAQDRLREIDAISGKAKEAASMIGVAQHAGYFRDEAADQRRLSSRWLLSTAVFAVAAGGYSLLTFRLGAGQLGEGAATWWPHIAYLTSRLIVLSVLFFGMGWSARNYRANKHNEIVNRHRQNALRTFETFAVAATDPATKDAVLLAATKSIFEAQTSGYIEGEPEKVASSTVVEILKSAISKGERS